jgi:two-component system sensor histidine kinase KdpD
VLHIPRVGAAHIAPRLELVELSDIVNGALRRKERALAGRELRVALPAELPMLRLDLFLLEHAVATVLDNAAKFSPAGSAVVVSARAQGSEVVLEIGDAGPGIRAEDRDRVFEPFFRGDLAGAGATAGSGLGLAICRAFVEANGGRVAVASDGAESGTRVEIRLPLPT